MTDLELEIETLRWRAPTVVPLADGRFVILGDGYIICTLEELRSAMIKFIEQNVLPPPKSITIADALRPHIKAKTEEIRNLLKELDL